MGALVIAAGPLALHEQQAVEVDGGMSEEEATHRPPGSEIEVQGLIGWGRRLHGHDLAAREQALPLRRFALRLRAPQLEAGEDGIGAGDAANLDLDLAVARDLLGQRLRALRHRAARDHELADLLAIHGQGQAALSIDAAEGAKTVLGLRVEPSEAVDHHFGVPGDRDEPCREAVRGAARRTRVGVVVAALPASVQRRSRATHGGADEAPAILRDQGILGGGRSVPRQPVEGGLSRAQKGEQVRGCGLGAKEERQGTAPGDHRIDGLPRAHDPPQGVLLAGPVALDRFSRGLAGAIGPGQRGQEA